MYNREDKALPDERSQKIMESERDKQTTTVTVQPLPIMLLFQ